jgi:hypothetical protein
MSIRFILYLVLLAFGVVYGLLKIKKSSKVQKKLFYLLIWVFSIEITGRIFAYVYKTSFPVYHIYLPGILIFYLFFFQDLFKDRITKAVFYYSGITLLPLLLSISHFYSNWTAFPSYQSVLLSLYIISGSLFCIKEMLEEPTMIPLFKQIKFVFCISNSFFYSINFFIFGFFDPFKKGSFIIPEWDFDVLYVSNIMLYSLYIYCLSIDEKYIERKFAIFKY